MKKMSALFVVILICSSLVSRAEEAPQSFLSALNKGQFHQALVLWPSSNEARSQSSTSEALFAYALYKDKMPLLGFDKLLSIPDLNSVSKSAKNLWRTELGVNSSFWRNTDVTWNNKLAAIFPGEMPSVISAWHLADIKSDGDFRKAQGLLRDLEGTDAGAWVKWQLALGYGLKNRTAVAVDYLQSLLDSNQHAVGQDEVLMAAARMLYQDNKLDLAMKYYDKISKGSDYWLESVEEKAWIYARLNNFERALGEMKTALSPAFASQVGPESYFLATLANLKVCDYASIFDILKTFKERNQARILEIQKLATTGHNQTSDQALVKLENGVETWADLGPDLDKVPRFVNRDETLNRAISLQRMGHQQKAEITKLTSENSYYSAFASSADQTSKNLEQRAPLRLKVLAQADVAEMKKNLMKLQLVDAEAVHRMHVGQTYAQEVKGGTEKSKVKDTIEFPYENNEIWLDEIDHYQASTKGCPVNKSPKVSQRNKGA
jgi:tetratricopeptide (TPR) repeat protein